LDALTTAQRLEPRFAMTYYYLGNIHVIQGDLVQARKDYQGAIQLDPNNEPARTALARLDSPPPNQ
jgi:cytochrome c-type biogenesis protein CcmH/NrfG